MVGQNVNKFYESSETLQRTVGIDSQQDNRNHLLVKVMDINNEPTYHELIETPMLGRNGENKGILGVSINVTEGKKAEMALQESEQRYKQLYENDQMGIISVRGGKFSMVNDAFCEMTGYTKAEIVGNRIKRVMHPEDYEATFSTTRKVDEGKTKGAIFEHRFIRKDGTIGYALLHHRQLFIEGAPLEAMATLTDISQLKATEQALRKSEAFYRSIFNYAYDGIEIYEIKDDSIFPVDRNERFRQMLGRTDEELDNYKGIEISPEYQPNGRMSKDFLAEQAEIIKRIGKVQYEWRALHKDGHHVDIQVTCVKFELHGKIIVTGIYRDLTETKKREIALQENETMYRYLFENAFDGVEIYEFFPDSEQESKLLQRNEKLRQLLGRTDKELTTSKEEGMLNISPKIQPNGMSSADWLKTIQQEFKKNQKIDTEWRFIHPQNYLIDVQFSIHIFNVGDKNIFIAIYKNITEKKKAEIALQESEAMYRHLFENAFDGIEIYDFFPHTGKVGKLLQRNEKLRQLLGRTDEQLINKGSESMLSISPKTQPNGISSADRLKIIQQDFKKDLKADIEWRFIHPQNYPIDVQLSVHTFSVGNKYVYISIYKDITEKKKAEIALRESETRYRYLFENAFDGIEIYEYTPSDSKKGRLITRNEKFRQLLGRTDEEISIGDVPTLLLSPKVQPNGMISEKYLNYLHKELKKNKEIHYEWRFNHKKGFPVDVEVYLHKYKQSDNTIILMGIFKDMTQKKKSEIALSESEALYRHLFENAFDGIEIYEYERVEGATSSLFARNDKLRYLLGRTDKEMDEGKGISTLRLSPDTQPNGRQSSEYLMEKRVEFNQNKIAAFEWQFTHKDGHFVDVYLTLQEYRINNKTILTGIYKDITERKKAEKIIQQNIDQLHQKNEELQKFIKSNMQLENFAYLASHDLKEPIRTIISFSQILKRSAYEKLSQDEQEYVDFIIKGSRNMSMLIEDLLTYSRADTEDKKIQTIKLNDLLYTVNYELNALIENSKAIIEIHNLPEIIQADKVQMRQLFQNLITNAVRYASPERIPHIKISAEEHDNEWLFAVNDNGIGIKSEFYERIFLLFRRLHGDKEKGTGIGLALCKKIVENHGGKIWVESEYGKGSTFYFTINKKP